MCVQPACDACILMHALQNMDAWTRREMAAPIGLHGSDMIRSNKWSELLASAADEFCQLS